MNALVTLLEPPYADLTYSLPKAFPENFWKEGLRVAVPLGRGPLRPGIVRALDVEAPQGVRLRDIAFPLEVVPILNPGLVRILEAVASRQCLTVGLAISQLVPLTRDMGVRVRRLDIKGREGTLSLKQAAALGPGEKKALVQELLSGRALLVPPHRDPAKSERVELIVSPPWPVRPAATRQREALEYLMFHGTTNRRTFMRELGEGASQIVQALLKLGCIRISSEEAENRIEELGAQLLVPSKSITFELNADQKAAVDELNALVDKNEYAQRLIFGVTGSGKTAVYITAARHCLESGRSVLLLAPEVALAHKLRNDLSTALPGKRVLFYHGYQGSSRREGTFRALAENREPVLVAGTRSSLFLPLQNVGLIILDEEHDASFKQEDRVPYQAKEVAWLKARQERAVLVLGSATPDIRTWHAACEGKIGVLRMPRRISQKPLPPVELINMGRRRIMSEEETLLAPESLKAIEETVTRGEQAIVLLNRRGFAPLIYCPDCRTTLTCPNCAVGLSFHRSEGRLLCHYCGYSLPFPSPCPNCHKMNFMPMGEGTERTTNYLSARFGHEVLRFDRDSTRREGAMEELLTRFARHEANILVGTQMLSKGHHFPDVTLAIVADGDLGLGLPDYRAAERTFQLLVQSSGRAGRGSREGRVLIQTKDVNHYCWKYVKNSDNEGFYEEEIARRKRYRFPPFSHVSLIRFSYERNDPAGSEAMTAAETWIRAKARERGIPLLGPVQSPIAFIGNRMRYQCLLKTDEWACVRTLYADLLRVPEVAKLKVSLNLDPYSML